MSDPQDRPGAADEPVGSVGDEAAKLLGALSEWARDHGADLGQGLGGLAGQAASLLEDVDEHVATGGPECTYCPVCRTMHAVRQTNPEVRAQLKVAASALLQAAAGLLATPVPPDATGRGHQVERIDLDDDLGSEKES
ncbi:hypothetical protein LRP67_11405 [Nocardioides sp. cx-169]|uniref:hypothetical protein n=1 Tax=Nocardioides sp. cx-169 TaxID=2899080 RepID=UPI001E2EAEFD|nr:hypothetical protein [Nocardioides sp. cx-169]MCD4534689.1 hypothetical protein [Nocardioides sp. cx-169]